MIDERLCRVWRARPDIDELLQNVEFRHDETGSLISGGGQAIFLEADFGWTMIDSSRLRLEFWNTTRNGRQTYRTSATTAVHEVGFDYQAGSFSLHVPMAMRVVEHRHRLKFAESPLPVDAAEYHRGSLFFTVVNSIDPRSFLAFYS